MATADLPNVPLLSLDAAGIRQTPGRSTGLIYENVDPPYAMANLNAVVRAGYPTRRSAPSAIRAPARSRDPSRWSRSWT